jgi:dipeptidyl aminopeptidase/acylaminoacyl peptidase
MTKHSSRHLSYLLLALLTLLAACGTPSGATSGNPHSDGATMANTQAATSQPTPQVQTSCPAAGTARAAVMPALTLGTHPTVVYTWNQATWNQDNTNRQFTNVTLRRYDTTNGTKTDIVTIQSAIISNAQISTDGQWLLFVVGFLVGGSPSHSAVQLVRLDGQYLQTLYCRDGGPGSMPVYWSHDQKTVIIEKFNSSLLSLDLASGTLQTIVTGNLGFQTWIDSTHFIAANILNANSSDLPTLYLVDVTKHDMQTRDLQMVWHGQSNCDSVIPSANPNILYMRQCALIQNQTGARQPSHIISIPLSGSLPAGWPQQIIVSEMSDITGFCLLNQQTILYTVASTVGSGTQGGLWKVSTDGSGKTSHLVTTNDIQPSTEIGLNYSSFSWSNVSRDGTMYAVELGGMANHQSLIFGSINGGNATTIAQADTNLGGVLEIDGWTTM